MQWKEHEFEDQIVLGLNLVLPITIHVIQENYLTELKGLYTKESDTFCWGIIFGIIHVKLTIEVLNTWYVIIVTDDKCNL